MSTVCPQKSSAVSGHWSLIGVLMILIGCYQLVRAHADYPIWDGDASGFWPHVKSYAETQSFNNAVFAPFLEWQTGYTQAENTYSHGFLTPMMLALLSGGDYHRLHMVLGLLHVASTFFLLLALDRVLPAAAPSWMKWLMRISVVLVFSWSCYDPSRPECVACAPVCLFLGLAVGRQITNWLVFFLGIGCALLFWCNPVPGALMVGMIGLFLVAGKEACPLKWRRAGLFAATAVGAGVGLFVALYPGDWAEFFRGFYQVGRFNLAISEWRFFISFFMSKVEYPLLLLPLVASGVLMLERARQNVRAGADAWLAGLTGVLFLLMCWALGVRAPFRSYVFLPLLPVLLIYLVPSACSGLSRFQGRVVARLAAAAIVFTGAANGAMMTADLVRFEAYLTHGVRLQTTRDWIAAVRKKAPEAKIGLTGALFPCVEGDARAALFHPQAPRSEDFLLVQQVNTGRLVPPVIEGYAMIGHNFVSREPRLLLKVGRITPGYSAALYERKAER
jgi:hypothetical protein